MAAKKPQKVVAVQTGYYKRQIHEGEVFEIEPGIKLGRWMRPYEEKEDQGRRAARPKRTKKPAPKPVEPETLKDVTDNEPKDPDWI